MFIYRSTGVGNNGFEVCRTTGKKSPRIVEIVLEVQEEKLAEHIAFLLDSHEKKFGIPDTKEFIKKCKAYFSYIPPLKKIDPASDMRYTAADPQLGDMGAVLPGQFPLEFSRKLN